MLNSTSHATSGALRIENCNRQTHRFTMIKKIGWQNKQYNWDKNQANDVQQSKNKSDSQNNRLILINKSPVFRFQASCGQ